LVVATRATLKAAALKPGAKRKAACSVPLPPIPAGMRKRGNRPLVKDVEKMLLSYGAVRMPEALKRRLKKSGMYGMPAE
jgi:hypothetical protein